MPWAGELLQAVRAAAVCLLAGLLVLSVTGRARAVGPGGEEARTTAALGTGERMVVPLGRAVGIKMFSDGVLVVGLSEITGEAGSCAPAKDCGLRQGDIITHINDTQVDTIEQVQSCAGLRVVSEVGTRLPLHCTSQGKVFLSAMADHEAKRVLSRRTLEPYTPKTLVTWEELFRVMQAARENGYAVEDGEYRFGLCSASAPVRDSSGAVRYAVGFVGMFDSVRSPDFQRDIDLTCAAAAQISTALGYRA